MDKLINELKFFNVNNIDIWFLKICMIQIQLNMIY